MSRPNVAPSNAGKSRLVAGLMSGTSLDGVDVAFVNLSGSGNGIDWEVKGYKQIEFPDDLRGQLSSIAAGERVAAATISELNVQLARLYHRAVEAGAEAANIPLQAIDLVGCHGQTVFHGPPRNTDKPRKTGSTLQLGDPSTLAKLLETPVVGQFRQADMALGGQGAPLVPYADWALFTEPERARGLLNIGGIANLTVLPPNASIDEVVAFDTGPGNILIDQLAQRLFDVSYDEDGRLAGKGSVDNSLLAYLLEHPFFHEAPPRSTGREEFGAGFVDAVLSKAESRPTLSDHDILATASALTAASVYHAYRHFVRPTVELDELLVSGGGVRNRFLMTKLADAFSPINVYSSSDVDMEPDAKEAVSFAVLAHETANGRPTNVPKVTGASTPTILGVWAFP